MHTRRAVLILLLMAQLGASPLATPRIGPSSPSGSALDGLGRSVTQPVPAIPAPAGKNGADVWVPDRVVPVPGQAGGAMVPGHWERRISDQQHYVPPLTATTPDGRTITVPAGIAPPPE